MLPKNSSMNIAAKTCGLLPVASSAPLRSNDREEASNRYKPIHDVRKVSCACIRGEGY
jgi:hypothetical protein